MKKLAGETAVYGLSSILGRMLGFLLVPLYTAILPRSEYGHITELLSYTAFLMVIFTYRMETALFRFGSSEEKKAPAYTTALLSILLSTLVFYALILVFADDIATALRYGDHVEYIVFIGMILAFDALCEIPFARLRLENRPWRFATIRLVNIISNIGFNLFFLLICPAILKHSEPGFLQVIIRSIYHPGFGVGYILLSQALTSGLTLLLLLPYYRDLPLQFDRKLWKSMFNYAWPLIIVGLAGIANETLDRAMMKWLLRGSPSQNDAQVGIYGACYKLTMILTLFTQAYRYSAEPFFFKQAAEGQSRHIYAQATKYFLIVASMGLLVTYLYMDLFQFLIAEPYREGLKVVPVLLFANLFLGLYYNVSIWYRLSDRTILATYISLGGALITIVLNIWWIPRFGYMGAAWATFFCYLCMLIVCHRLGKKHFPIPYQLRYLGFLVGLTALLCLINAFGVQRIDSMALRLLLNTLLLGLFAGILYLLEKDRIRQALRRKAPGSDPSI